MAELLAEILGTFIGGLLAVGAWPITAPLYVIVTGFRKRHTNGG